jgi:hypothetical protein
MITDCQSENESIEPIPYSELPQALVYALDRVVDKVRSGASLPREDVMGFDCYAYACGEKISRGVNSPLGFNIFRDQIDATP